MGSKQLPSDMAMGAFFTSPYVSSSDLDVGIGKHQHRQASSEVAGR